MALYGIHGRHTPDVCPIYVPRNARVFTAIAELDPGHLAREYGIHTFVARYHSALEHTFLWVVDADSPHLIEHFSVDTDLARFNDLKIVPLHRFADTVQRLRESHGL